MSIKISFCYLVISLNYVAVFRGNNILCIIIKWDNGYSASECIQYFSDVSSLCADSSFNRKIYELERMNDTNEILILSD